MGVGSKILDAIITGAPRAVLTDKLTGGTDVLLNSVMSWTENLPSEVTKHAVEEGAPITDNVFNDPASYSISAILTDSVNILFGPTFAKTRTVAQRVSQLKKWRDEKQVLFYVHDETISNLVIKDMGRTKRKDLGGLIPFGPGSAAIDFTLQVINIAKTVQQEGIKNNGLVEKIPAS